MLCLLSLKGVYIILYNLYKRIYITKCTNNYKSVCSLLIKSDNGLYAYQSRNNVYMLMRMRGGEVLGMKKKTFGYLSERLVMYI